MISALSPGPLRSLPFRSNSTESSQRSEPTRLGYCDQQDIRIYDRSPELTLYPLSLKLYCFVFICFRPIVSRQSSHRRKPPTLQQLHWLPSRLELQLFGTPQSTATLYCQRLTQSQPPTMDCTLPRILGLTKVLSRPLTTQRKSRA